MASRISSRCPYITATWDFPRNRNRYSTFILGRWNPLFGKAFNMKHVLLVYVKPEYSGCQAGRMMKNSLSFCDFCSKRDFNQHSALSQMFVYVVDIYTGREEIRHWVPKKDRQCTTRPYQDSPFALWGRWNFVVVITSKYIHVAHANRRRTGFVRLRLSSDANLRNLFASLAEKNGQRTTLKSVQVENKQVWSHVLIASAFCLLFCFW